MQGLINKPERVTTELLEGLVLTQQDKLTLVDDRIVLSKGLADKKRVVVIAFGGTGNEPALSGFVGEGLLDVFVAGDVFAAPGPAACLKAVQLADRGEGVLVICANHTGDVLTANIIRQQAQRLGLQLAVVAACDDAAQVGRELPAERRGLLGCMPLCKIAAAAAAGGKSLEEVAALAQRLADNMATLAVLLTQPETDDKGAGMTLLIGAGIHGEAGSEALPLLQADEAAALLTARLLTDLQASAGEQLLVLVSGSGSVSLAEQLIVFRGVYAKLEGEGLAVAASHVGELLALPADGLQLCLARLDDELLALWQAPCNTPYYKQL